MEQELGPPQQGTEHFLAGLSEQSRAEHSTPVDMPALRRALHHYSLASRLSARPRLSIVQCYAHAADLVDVPAAREEAVVTLTTLWPDSSRAWGTVAWILRNVDPPRAKQAIDRALELYPDELGLLDIRACILEQLGDREAAIQDLERTLQLHPGASPARAALARLRSRPQ